MFQHHILPSISSRRVYFLYRTAGKSAYGLGSRIIAGTGNFIRQLIQGFLDPGNGRHHADLIHRGDGFALRNDVAVSHQILGQLHFRGDFQLHGGSAGELAAADDLGINVLIACCC